jgi:single-strand DNA-binding protein
MANSTNLTGYLASDPKPRTHGELRVCDLRLAVRRRPGRDRSDRGAFFIDVVTFGGLADACGKHLAKGSRIGVTGELDVQEWSKDGQRRWTPKVFARQVEFLSPRPQNDSGDPQAALAEVPSAEDQAPEPALAEAA